MNATGAEAPRISPSPMAWAMERAVRLYQLTFAAVVPGQCRFEPSCSAYAREALSAHGALKGAWLTLRRLARCHPWGECGVDPVPPVPAAAEHTHKTCGHR
ncbi:MAG: membrane protein insertion efficiency factor YidD [Rhodospirillales bacterium]